MEVRILVQWEQRDIKHMKKILNLDISLKLGFYIEKYFPDVEVIYTRKTDVFLELWERTEIANKRNADLFISIHCDGFKNSNLQEQVFLLWE